MNFRNHHKTPFNRRDFQKDKQRFNNSRHLVTQTGFSTTKSCNLDSLNGEFLYEFNQKIVHEAINGMKFDARRNLPEALGINFTNFVLFLNPVATKMSVMNFVKTMMFDRFLMSKVEVSNSINELRKIKDGFLVLHVSSLGKKIGDEIDLTEDENVMHKSAYDSRSDQSWFAVSKFVHNFINMVAPKNKHVVRAHIEGVGNSPYIGLKSGVNSVHNLSLKIGEIEGLCAIPLDKIPDKELRRLKYCSVSNTFLIPEDFLGGKVRVEGFVNVLRENFSRVNYIVTAFQGVATLLIGLAFMFVFASISHILIAYLKFWLILFLLKNIPSFRNLFQYKYKVGDVVRHVKQSASQWLSNTLDKTKKVFSFS